MGAFADYAEKEAGGALQYYADISHPLHVVKTAVYVVQTTLGDSVVVRYLFLSLNFFRSSSWFPPSMTVEDEVKAGEMCFMDIFDYPVRWRFYSLDELGAPYI